MPTQNIFDLVDTWASGGGPYTSIKMNATDNDSGSASLLMDLQVGTVSKFKVSKAGGITTPQLSNTADQSSIAGTIFGTDGNGPTLSSASQLSLRTNGSSTALYLSSAGVGIQGSDLYLTRRGTANLRFGQTDAAAPVAQTLSVQSVVTGTSNTAGANFTITGSQGTGNAAGGSIIFQVAPLGSSGSAQNALATALTINSASVATFASDVLSSASTPSYGKSNCKFLFGNPTADAVYFTQSSGGIVGPVLLNNQGITIETTCYLGFGGSSGYAGSPDTILRRDDSNKLALRNGTAAQEFRVYNSYTDVSNYAYLFFKRSAAYTMQIGTAYAGSGENCAISILPAAGGSLTLGANNTTFWTLTTSGHITAATDNLYDIGASGATRPRNVYAGGNITSGTYFILTDTSGAFYWVGSTVIRNRSDGVLTISNQGENAFGRLQFGGTTSSFPAIKRSSTTLQARLADDSAFAPVQGKLTTDTAYTAGAPTATGYLVVYDSAGTAYKIPALAV